MSDLSFEQLRGRVAMEARELGESLYAVEIDWHQIALAYKQLGAALSNLKRVDIEQRAFEVSGVDL